MVQDSDRIAALKAELAFQRQEMLDDHAMAVAAMLTALHGGNHTKAIAFLEDWKIKDPAELWEHAISWLAMNDEEPAEPGPQGDDDIPV